MQTVTAHSDLLVLFYITDSVKEDIDIEADEATPDLFALRTHNGVPPHLLHLKLESVCNLMHNLCVQKGLVKNAHNIIQSLHRHFIQVQVINNRINSLGETQCISRIQLKIHACLLTPVGPFSEYNYLSNLHMHTLSTAGSA